MHAETELKRLTQPNIFSSKYPGALDVSKSPGAFLCDILLSFVIDSAPMKQQRSIQFQLTGVELIVGTFECEKLVVGTALDDPTMLQNHNGVTVSDGG